MSISVGDIVKFKDTSKCFKVGEDDFEKVIVASVSPVVLINEVGSHFWANLNIDELLTVGKADVDIIKKVLEGMSRIFLSRELCQRTIIKFLAEYGKSVELDCNFDPKEITQVLEGDISTEELQNISLTIIPKLTELKTINYISEKVDEITKRWGEKQKKWKKGEK